MFSKMSATIQYHSKITMLSSLNLYVSSVIKQHFLAAFHILSLIKSGLILVAFLASLTCAAVFNAIMCILQYMYLALETDELNDTKYISG